jgi:HAD superfamily PSPase-like hydrolase
MRYKLVCFDFDGTLLDVKDYIWNDLHDAFGVPLSYRKTYWDLFLSRKITYEEWFDSDVNQWVRKGIYRKDFIRVISKLKLITGSQEALRELKHRGYKLLLVSGTINIVIDTLLPEHPFDEVLANTIKFDADGKISSWKATPYDFEHKVTAMKAIAKQEGITLGECVFVGDNDNDVQAIEAAGLGIAFNPKSEKVKKAADVIIEKKDVREILVHLE